MEDSELFAEESGFEDTEEELEGEDTESQKKDKGVLNPDIDSATEDDAWAEDPWTGDEEAAV